MIERFNDPTDGKRKLIECIQQQSIVANNEDISNFIADNCTLKELSTGQKLIDQEDSDSDIHFVISGNLSVIVNGREIAVRSAKQHVGEMALIDPSAKRSATVVAKEVTVIATLTESSFSKIANEQPILWRRIAVELAHRLRERSKYIKRPNGKPMVFIGSSSENLDFAKKLREKIQNDSRDVSIWCDGGIFELSKSALDSLITSARNYDFAVMIFDDNDIVESRSKTSYAPRDNVIFELGLFMGSLGAERSYIVRSNSADLKIPSDLLGITTLVMDKDKLDESLGAVSAQISSAIDKLGTK